MTESRYNVLMGDLPEEWNGHGLNTDFRTGICIVQVMGDAEFSGSERLSYACELLYKDPPASLDDCLQGLLWYLGGWNRDGKAKEAQDDVVVMDYDIDQWRIYAAFLKQYRIDLNSADMHFWVFMGLLTNLDECSFTRVIDVRTIKLDPKMPQKQKEALKKAKQIYMIDRNGQEDEEISPAREEFLKFAGLSK